MLRITEAQIIGNFRDVGSGGQFVLRNLHYIASYVITGCITSLPGYTDEEKRMLARRLKGAASNLLGIMPFMVSVSMKDLLYHQWDDFISTLSEGEIVIPESRVDKSLLN